MKTLEYISANVFVVLQDRLCSRRMKIFLRFSGSEFIPKTERCDRSVDFQLKKR